MTALAWDQVGQRLYETGVDHGVLYPNPVGGVYALGIAWNGLTTVTESPSGAEATPQYADNIKYLNLISYEDFGGTIEAFTYPVEWGQCDGSYAPSVGIAIGQQGRKTFGLSYRTKVGNDTDPDAGYKLHLVYGAQAAPSEKAHTTVNDTPEAMTFSWEFSTTPVAVSGQKPTAVMTIDSTKVLGANLAALETILYGTVGVDPRLPLPDEVIALFAGGITAATPVAPTFVSGTGVITIPATTGIDYRRADTNAIVPTGTVTVLPATPGASLIIYATPKPTYYLAPGVDDDWMFTRT